MVQVRAFLMQQTSPPQPLPANGICATRLRSPSQHTEAVGAPLRGCGPASPSCRPGGSAVCARRRGGRGRVIFTSLQAAGATGSERAARQMWGARQLGAATAGRAAGPPGADPRAQVPALFPAAPASPARSPLTPIPLFVSVVASLSPVCSPVPAVPTVPTVLADFRVPDSGEDPSRLGDHRVPAE